MARGDGVDAWLGPERSRRVVSVITPAHNEAENLPPLYQRLSQVMNGLDLEWEWIVVDDHSTDATFATLVELARQDPHMHAIRLARNFGAHTATACGFHHAKGDCAIHLGADLQHPPETLPRLLHEWQAGAQVVWAVRSHRQGESPWTVGFARLYYFLMRRVVGLKELPATDADLFLIDRCVLDAFCLFHESNVSLLALIAWMGFRQVSIPYDKQARMHGHSRWSLEKKLKLVVDSVTSFTYLPIRLMSYVGIIVSLLGFLYAGLVILYAFGGRSPEGWSSLMVVVLVIGGLQMLMMGVLGEYLWRVLDESRRRPRYWIEATTDARVDRSEIARRRE